MILIKPKGSLFCLFVLVLCSCSSMGTVTTSYLPKTFSTENIMKAHQGMNSDEVLKLFGPPKDVSQAVCGGKTGRHWTCTTWEYGKFPYDKASFTFNGSKKTLILNDFAIEREGGGETLPSAFTTENIMKIHQGISSKQILKIFGFPKNVSQAVCGGTTGHPWTCTTWEYGKFPYERASFTFSGKYGSLILNDFKVKKNN